MQILQKREGMASPEGIDGIIFDFEKGHVVVLRDLIKGQPQATVEQAASQLLTRALERGEPTKLLTLNEEQFKQIMRLGR